MKAKKKDFGIRKIIKLFQLGRYIMVMAGQEEMQKFWSQREGVFYGDHGFGNGDKGKFHKTIINVTENWGSIVNEMKLNDFPAPINV